MLQVSISKEGLDHEWDSFLETTPDCCYQQSSLWAKLKARGWRHLRLVVRESDTIVGGVQALLRPLPLFGTVGYVDKGPVIASDNPAIQEFVLDQLDRVARAEHILFLKIQPPYGAEELAQRLLERGGRRNEISVTALATPVIDIRPEPDAILARMHPKARYNIRRAERKGVTVRECTEADIPAVHRLAEIHAKFQRYTPGSLDHYYDVWSTLSPGSHFCAFLAEYEGEALAASTNIVFGDVITNKVFADNGRHRDLNATSLLHWKTILWGREHGCARYDLGGIQMEDARAIVNGEPFPDTHAGGIARFKMSFGSQLMFRPGVCDVSYLWPRRLTGRLVPALIKMKPLLNFLIGSSLARGIRGRDRRAKRAAAKTLPAVSWPCGAEE
jgi:peptidoglycan pentaglycine glycine transferase (the first glycine)